MRCPSIPAAVIALQYQQQRAKAQSQRTPNSESTIPNTIRPLSGNAPFPNTSPNNPTHNRSHRIRITAQADRLQHRLPEIIAMSRTNRQRRWHRVLYIATHARRRVKHSHPSQSHPFHKLPIRAQLPESLQPPRRRQCHRQRAILRLGISMRQPSAASYKRLNRRQVRPKPNPDHRAPHRRTVPRRITPGPAGSETPSQLQTCPQRRPHQSRGIVKNQRRKPRHNTRSKTTTSP